jgi:hypothetical protein
MRLSYLVHLVSLYCRRNEKDHDRENTTMRTREVTRVPANDPGTINRLKDEISTLEQRLQQIGPEGDCGYEKAMIRFFRDQIDRRRRQLDMSPLAG